MKSRKTPRSPARCNCSQNLRVIVHKSGCQVQLNIYSQICEQLHAGCTHLLARVYTITRVFQQLHADLYTITPGFVHIYSHFCPHLHAFSSTITRYCALQTPLLLLRRPSPSCSARLPFFFFQLSSSRTIKRRRKQVLKH